MTQQMPPYLVDTEWLHEHLHDNDLRIFDCSVFLRPIEGGVRLESGRAEWEKQHIPGSGFADILGDLSDRNTSLPAMLPPAAQFAEAMSRYGVGNEHRVVVYDTGMGMWAARMWWILRVFGFTNVAVLNGGLKKWTAESRPVSAGIDNQYQPAHFTAHVSPDKVVSKQEVLATISNQRTDQQRTQLVNALSAEEFSGKITRVARPGHIPGSTNVPAGTLIDPRSNTFLPAEQLQALFAPANALHRDRVITYCGGGIAACSVAFGLAIAGAKNVAVYDGSLAEWAADPTLPLQTASEL